jgi:hypothetical protein
MTTHLGLTARVWNGISISRRATDGYVNATAMCRAGGKRWNHYAANYRSQSYIASLAAVTGNPATGIGGTTTPPTTAHSPTSLPSQPLLEIRPRGSGA